MRNLRLLRSCTSTAAAVLLLCGAPASAQDAAKAPASSTDASTDKRIDELTREVADLKGLVLRLQEQLRQVIGAPLAKEKGVWVFRTGQPLAASVTDDLLQQIREQRDKQNLTTPE